MTDAKLDQSFIEAIRYGYDRCVADGVPVKPGQMWRHIKAALSRDQFGGIEGCFAWRANTTTEHDEAVEIVEFIRRGLVPGLVLVTGRGKDHGIRIEKRTVPRTTYRTKQRHRNVRPPLALYRDETLVGQDDATGNGPKTETEPKTKRAKPPLDPLIQRLVEMTFAPIDQISEWLTRLGLEVRYEAGGKVINVFNPHFQMRTAVVATADPTTRAVSLGFATAGPYWPYAYPGLLKAVNEQWWYRRKEMYTEE